MGKYFSYFMSHNKLYKRVLRHSPSSSSAFSLSQSSSSPKIFQRKSLEAKNNKQKPWTDPCAQVDDVNAPWWCIFQLGDSLNQAHQYLMINWAAALKGSPATITLHFSSLRRVEREPGHIFTTAWSGFLSSRNPAFYPSLCFFTPFLLLHYRPTTDFFQNLSFILSTNIFLNLNFRLYSLSVYYIPSHSTTIGRDQQLLKEAPCDRSGGQFISGRNKLLNLTEMGGFPQTPPTQPHYQANCL